MKIALAACLTATVLVAALAGPSVAERTTAPKFAPACPSPRYAVDGNMAPLFCVIDNPAALRYFARGARHLFALGPSATPAQVINALQRDFNTEPIGCSEYRLAAWRNRWRFGISPIQAVAQRLHLPNDWCSEPRFNVDY